MLKLRDGLVRCGRCRQVFSGKPGSRGPKEAQGRPGLPSTSSGGGPGARPGPAGPRIEAASRAALPSTSGATSATARDAPVPAEPEFVLPPPDFDSPSLSGPGEADASARPSGRGRAARIATWVLAGLLALTLCLQTALGARDWLVTAHPAIAPQLRRLAALVDAEVRPPARLDTLTIQSFDLESLDEPGRFKLHAVLRNAAAHPVRWPWLDLSLTGPGDGSIARRALRPSEYLAGTPDAEGKTGIGAGSEIEIRLVLEIDPPAPENYNVTLFHP